MSLGILLVEEQLASSSTKLPPLSKAVLQIVCAGEWKSNSNLLQVSMKGNEKRTSYIFVMANIKSEVLNAEMHL